MPEDITAGVEAIEQEAERILEHAKSQASEIRARAREQASRLLNSELPLQDVQKECDEIVRKAREEADAETERSGKEASQITVVARKKLTQVARHLVEVVIGSEPT